MYYLLSTVDTAFLVSISWFRSMLELDRLNCDPSPLCTPWFITAFSTENTTDWALIGCCLQNIEKF